MAKTKNHAAAGKSNAPAVKDDGSRYTVLHAASDKQVYTGAGVTLNEALSLAQGLVAPTRIVAFDNGVVGEVKYVVGS